MSYLSGGADDDVSAGAVSLWLVLSLLLADKHRGCAADDCHLVSRVSLDGDGSSCAVHRDGIHGGSVLYGKVTDGVYKVCQYPTLCRHGRIADNSFADDPVICHHSSVPVVVEEE